MRAYHLYIAFFYCVGIAGVYLLVRVAARSRGMAWLCAAATALMSPSFLFLRAHAERRLDAAAGAARRAREIRRRSSHDGARAHPHRVDFHAGSRSTRRVLWAIALAAVFCGGRGVQQFLWRYRARCVLSDSRLELLDHAAGPPHSACPPSRSRSLTYGLTAFWLVPSYFKVTAENLKYVSEHGTTWSIWIALAVAVVFALAI